MGTTGITTAGQEQDDRKGEKAKGTRSRYAGLDRWVYVLGGALLVVGLVIWVFDEANRWNGISLLSFGTTVVGVAVAVTIFKAQGAQTRQNESDTKLTLREIRAHSSSTLDIVTEMAGAREAANAPAPDAVAAQGGGQSPELSGTVTPPSQPTSQETEESDNAGVSSDIVKLAGDGEYRKPRAIPLYVISDLVRWWPAPKYYSQRWTLGNVIGAYRKYNADGKLTGAPWIVTFRRSAGNLVEYRLAYSGAANGPAISEFSSSTKRWVEGEPPSQP